MTQPLKTETWQVVEALELEKLIREVYGRPFSVLAHHEASNGSVHWLEVPADEGFYFEEDQLVTLDEWQALPLPSNSWDDSGPKPRYEDIINDLHARGLLPAGSLRLHCWW